MPQGAEGEVLRRLGDGGVLDKLYMMDSIMGQSDRHSANYVFTPGKDSELHLIDNGNLFGVTSPNHVDYIRHYGNLAGLTEDQMPIHHEAIKWVLGLDPNKLHQSLHEHLVSDSRIDETVKKLLRLQHVLKTNPPGITKSHIPQIAQGVL